MFEQVTYQEQRAVAVAASETSAELVAATLAEATIEWKLTDGIAEHNNAAIGRIRSAARGFQDPQASITMIMLERADLPWATA